MSSLGLESRALLDEGRDALRPAAADRDRILSVLKARTYVPAPELGVGPASSAVSGLGWPLISTIVVGLAFGGGLLLQRLSSADQPAPPAAVIAPVAKPVAPPPPPPSTVTEPPSGVPSPPAVEPTRAKARSLPVSRASDNLAEEVALLARAEKELHAGRFAASLALVSEHQRKFPRGTLSQERNAARIQALCGLGRVKDADAELARVSPDSLHGGRVREACAGRSVP